MKEKFHKFLESVTNFFSPQPSPEVVTEVLDLLDRKEEEQSEKTNAVKKDLEKNLSKRVFFEKSLENGIAVLYLDPRISGVIVPEKFSGQSLLVLNYSYKYGVNDFMFDDNLVVASLSFGGFPFRCVVPWEAVGAIVDHSRGILCNFGGLSEEDVMALKVKEKEKTEIEKSPDRVFQTKNGKAKLMLIKGGKE